MLAGYRWKSNAGVLLYFAFKFGAILFAVFAAEDSPRNTVLFYLIYLTGTAFLAWGCWAQARGRGYSGWYAVLAVLEIFGLIILALMPDRRQKQANQITAA